MNAQPETKVSYRAGHLCEAICHLEIRTGGDAIDSIKGDKLGPLRRGHICPKAVALQVVHEDPDRQREKGPRRDLPGVSYNDLSDESSGEVVLGDAALNALPVTLERIC